MGNNVSTEKKPPCRSQPSVSSCFGCLVAQNNHDGFDSTELKIGIDGFKPRGKITEQSIAYLSNDEINFFKAASGRNVSLIRFYLSKGININILDEERTSPLHVAARHGSIQVVEELINSGANLNITDMAGWTRNMLYNYINLALHVAASFSRYQVCEILLKAAADHTIRNRENNLAQDLVRDKMTLEKFKAHANQTVNAPNNESIGEMSFAFEKQKLQRQIAKEQFQDYFKNLKKNKLTYSAVRDGASRQPDSRNVSGHNTPLKQRVNKENQGNYSLTFSTEDLNKSNNLQQSKQSLLDQESESVSYHYLRQKSSHSKMISEIPQEEAEKDKIFDYSPSQSQKSVFFKEIDNLSLTQLIEFLHDKQFGPFESGSREVHEFALELLNVNYILGLGYLILSHLIKATPQSVAQFLHKEDFQKINISEILTNGWIKESLYILQLYIEWYTFSHKDYINCLRDFFNKLICENDPFKLDMLVAVLSSRIFTMRNKKSNLRQFPFKSTDSIHMFTFALVILDIEINLNKGKANSKKLEVAVQDFTFHIQSINDGDNFDQDFINEIIDDVRKNKIVNINSNSVANNDLSTLREKLGSLSSIGGIKVIKKKKEVLLNYELYLLGTHLILQAEENRIKIIPFQMIRFQCQNKRDLILLPKLGFSHIYVAYSKGLKTFKVKDHLKLSYMLANQADWVKLDAKNI